MGAMRLHVLAVSIGVLVAACAPAAGSPVGPASASSSGSPTANPAAGYRLYVHDGFGRYSQPIRVIDTGTGLIERELTFGIPAPDWSRLYTVESTDRITSLRVVDPRSSKILRETVLDGLYGRTGGVPGTLPLSISPDGHWLVLENTTPDSQGWISRTGYLVIDTTFTSPPRRLELEGWMPLHAISNDGTHLYVNEYVRHGAQNVRNRLHFVNIGSGRLDPLFVLDRSQDQRGMTGSWYSAVTSPDGRFLYNIYVERSVYADEDQTASVYALDLNTGTISSVELPWGNRANWEAQLYWLLTITPDGSTLYALNGALGLIAELDTKDLHILRAAALQRPPGTRKSFQLFRDAEAKVPLAGGAILSREGATIFAPALKGLVAIDTRKLTFRTYLHDWRFDSLALSPDGAWLYGLSTARAKLVQIDPRSVSISAEVGGAQGPISLLRVEASSR